MSENTVDVLFRTRAELQGAQQFAAELERQIGKAKASGKDFAELDAQLAKVRKAIETSPKPSGPGWGDVFDKIRDGLGDVVPGFAKLDGVLSKFAGGALGVIGGGFATMAVGLEAAKKSLEEFAHAEQQVAQLDAALAQTGQLTDAYREQLQELAQQLQDTTAIADDQWLAVLTRLTQFGANTDNIEEYTDAVKNLAGLLGGDVQQAASVFSRALQGNFEMFSRYGIVVDDAGTKTEKLHRVMEELAQRGGGQLEAAARGLTGQWRQFSNATADLSKGLGRAIAETGLIQGALGLATDAASYWAEAIGGVIPKLEGLENATKPTSEAMNDSAESAKRMAQGVKEVEGEATDAASALDALIAKIHQLTQAQDEVESAQMALEIAKVDEANPAGGSAALQAKGAIRQKFAKSKFERGQAAIQAEIKAREDAYQETASEVDAAEKAVAAQKKDVAQRREVEAAQARVKSREQAFARAEGEYSQAQEDRASRPLNPSAAGAAAAGRVTGEMDDRVREAAGVLQAEGYLLKEAREKLEKLGPQPSGAITAAQSEAQLKQREAELAARQKALEAAAQPYSKIDELRRQADTNQRVYTIRNQADETGSRADVEKRRQEEEKRVIEEQMKMHGKSASVERFGEAMQAALSDLNDEWLDAFKGVAEQVKAARQELSVLKDRGTIRS